MIVRVSMVPRVKSCIWLKRLKEESTRDCQVEGLVMASARNPSRNILIPKTKLTMAAAIWLRVNEEAKQPRDKNRQPVTKMPRYIPPIVPASSESGWLV